MIAHISIESFLCVRQKSSHSDGALSVSKGQGERQNVQIRVCRHRLR